MTYKIVDSSLGMLAQGLTSVSTTQNLPLGTIASTQSDDAVQLGGKAMYVKSADAILANSLVNIAQSAVTGSVLAPATGGVGAVGVAAAAIPSGSYGWVFVQGVVPVKAPNAMTVGADVFPLAATPGSVDDAAVNGEQILNAKVVSTTGTPSTGLALIGIEFPFHQGQVV